MPQQSPRFAAGNRIGQEMDVNEFEQLALHHEAQAKHYDRAVRQLASDCRGSRALTALKAELHREFGKSLRDAIARSAARDSAPAAVTDQVDVADEASADSLSQAWMDDAPAPPSAIEDVP